MEYFFLYLAGMMLLIGVLIKKFKFYWLISGYNTASKERKEQMDKEGLGQLVGNYMYFLGGMFVVAFLLMWYKFENASFFVFLIVILSSIYIMIKAQKYDKGAFKSDGSMKMGQKISIGITALVVVGAIGMVLYGLVPTKYVVNEDSLTIEGMYGDTISVQEMKKVELVESLPNIIVRTNGYAAMNVLKGHFKLEQLGKGKLFIRLDRPPYIIIHTDQMYYIINEPDGSKTKELYEKINNLKEKSS